MAFGKKFQIPSLRDMEDDDSAVKKVSSGSLFETHRPAVQANIEEAKKSPAKVLHVQATSVPGSASRTSQRTTSANITQASSTNGQDSNKLVSNSFNSNAQRIQGSTFAPGSFNKTNIVNICDTTSNSSKVCAQTGTSSVSNSKLDTGNEKDLSGAKLGPAQPAKTSSIQVSSRQRGNPILKFIRNIPWEYADIVPDYQVGKTSCALFLSLRYHQIKPDYIHERLKQLGHSFNLRVLLVLIDIKDPHHCLKELAKMCILADCTLVVAFSQEEAGRYLETYKCYENKSPELIMERVEGNIMSRMTDCLTKARRVNKTDVITLLSAFGSFENIVNTSEEDLSLCPGFGPQKAQRLSNIFQEPFLKSKRKGSPVKKSSPVKRKKASPPKNKADPPAGQRLLFPKTDS